MKKKVIIILSIVMLFLSLLIGLFMFWLAKNTQREDYIPASRTEVLEAYEYEVEITRIEHRRNKCILEVYSKDLDIKKEFFLSGADALQFRWTIPGGKTTMIYHKRVVAETGEVLSTSYQLKI